MLSFTKLTQQEADRLLLDSYCPELLKTKLEGLPEIAERRQLVTEITEGYFEQYDKMPVSRVLQMLADYLLLDYIKTPHKTVNDSDPFHSPSQARHRREKEDAMTEHHMDYFNTGNVWNFAKQRTTQEISEND